MAVFLNSESAQLGIRVDSFIEPRGGPRDRRRRHRGPWPGRPLLPRPPEPAATGARAALSPGGRKGLPSPCGDRLPFGRPAAAGAHGVSRGLSA